VLHSSLRPPHIGWRNSHLARALRELLVAIDRSSKLRSGPALCGLSWCCCILFCLPGGGRCGRGWSQLGLVSWVGGTRRMSSGEIWGQNGPAAGALIGLNAINA
jgi:hypothetical protein